MSSKEYSSGSRKNIQNVAKQHFEQRTSFNVLKIDVSIPLQNNNNNNNNIHTQTLAIISLRSTQTEQREKKWIL